MASRSAERQIEAEQRADGSHIRVVNFLERELPPSSVKEAAYLADALLEAGARYNRYTARRSEWLDYTARRDRLNRITGLIDGVAVRLPELDILSRDDLATRIDNKAIEALIGSLRLLSRETRGLAEEVQKSGRPRDLAEERWIREVADIYENAFCRPARVSGSGNGEAKRRGSFYSLLEHCRPLSFPRHGKLTVRQISRVLKRRKQFKRRSQ